jgi:hypothetical protein
MSGIFQFPEPTTDRKQMLLFQTPVPPLVNEDDLMRRGRDFGVEGQFQDLGSRIFIRSPSSFLEVFIASDSIRWGTLLQESEGERNGGSLPVGDRALDLAEAFLERFNLQEESAAVRSVTFTQMSRMDRDDSEPSSRAVATHVNYGFTLDGLPIVGPGAKMQVTLGPNEQVAEAYKFWRRPIKARMIEIIDEIAAQEVLRQDEAYVDLRDGEASVILHRCQLSYFGLPPREFQGYLIPVYAFTGTVSTPELERYDFTRYVVAVRLSAEEAKELRAVHRAPLAVF